MARILINFSDPHAIVENVEITKPEQEIIVAGYIFTGKRHNNLKPNAAVRGLTFRRSPRLQYFPRDLQKHFCNLEDLTFVNCGIKEISKQDLRGLQNLKYFSMTNGYLTSLPDDLFTDMPNLVGISFNYNQIEAASSNLLKPFIGKSGRFSVELRGNKNIDAFFDSNYHSSDIYKSLEELMRAVDEKCIKPVKLPLTVMDADDFNQEIKKLWKSGKFSDIKIISDNREFNVHRNILGIRSSVMAEILEDHKEASKIKIKNFSPLAVESLLHFIYTNEIIHEDCAAESFVIADKFKIQKMKSAFEKIISDNLKESNAYETFLLADQNEAKELKQKSFKIICDKFADPLPEALMEDPSKLKKLIDNRREYEKLLENPIQGSSAQQKEAHDLKKVENFIADSLKVQHGQTQYQTMNQQRYPHSLVPFKFPSYLVPSTFKNLSQKNDFPGYPGMEVFQPPEPPENPKQAQAQQRSAKQSGNKHILIINPNTGKSIFDAN